MSDSSMQPLTKDEEMEDYGTTRKWSAAATALGSKGGTKRSLPSLTPPPYPNESSWDPPPPYDSLSLQRLSTKRRHSCPPNPTGIPYLGAGKEFYDAGDYHQLTACIVLSCLVLWLFNPLFGIAAFIIAVIGKRKAREEDYVRANHYAKLSCYISLAGIIVAAIVACVLLTIFLAQPFNAEMVVNGTGNSTPSGIKG